MYVFFILSAAETKNNNLVAKYHPNFWMEGKWRCCQQTEKLAAGCHVYDPVGYGLCYLFFKNLFLASLYDSVCDYFNFVAICNFAICKIQLDLPDMSLI